MNRKRYAYPYLLWMVALILAPMILIAFYAFTRPEGEKLVFSWKYILQAFEPGYLSVLGYSLYLAFLATVVCLLIAYPVAYILSRMPAKRSAMFSVFFILPMWMNMLLRTYAWMTLLDNNGLINQLLSMIGIGKVQFLYTPGAVVAGLVYNFLPFMVLPIYNALQKIPKANIEAAQDLGANSRQVFSKVIFPLSLPGVVSGITMVFVPAITTFTISRLLGGSHFMMFGDLIEMQFLQAQNWNFGSALSMILLILVFISMWLSEKVDSGSEGGVLQ